MNPAPVILPSSPTANCEFTFEPNTSGFFINFNGQTANLPGISDAVSQWTIPVVSAFRTDFMAVTLQFNGMNWEESFVSSPLYQTTVESKNAAQFTHGQVYFYWNTSASQFVLCPQNGPGGLIVDGAMRQIPSDCLTLAQSETSPSQTNFFYAVHGDVDNLSVNSAALDPSGKIIVTFTSPVNGNINDQVRITCNSIGGAAPANVSDTGKILASNEIEFLNASSAGWNPYTSGGLCYIVRLAASTTGHVTNGAGVEVKSDDGHYTLVGIAYIGASNAVNDSVLKRDVASWFNRHPKKMLVSCNLSMTTVSSTLQTPQGNTCEGEFVVFAEPQGSPSPAVRWSITTGISNSVSTNAVGNVTACFGSSSLGTGTACGNPPEPETGTASLFALSKIMPIGVSGTTTTLSEGRNFMDLIGDTSTGLVTYLTGGTNNDTTVGAMVMQ